MANSNGWGDGSVNNSIGWGQGANNAIGWGKSHLNSWAGATDIDGGNAPINSVAPAISGTAQEGQTVTCSSGTWSGSPTYTYQWYRGASAIGSATSSSYTLVTADVGQNIKCVVTATNFSGSATADSNTITPTSSVDADAQAFITAASITNPTQQSAINQLVVDLKGYSIWTKFQALYPMVGGSSTTCKYNLKDPRDLDAAYRLIFNGGWTFSSTGAKPNGTNGYANTKYIPNSNGTQNSAAISYYSRTNINENGVEIGSFSGAGSYLAIKYSGTNTLYRINTIGTDLPYSDANSQGFYLANRTASNVINGWKNNSKVVTGTLASDNSNNQPLYLSAWNQNGGANLYSTKECAFASIGSGLTDTEAANFYTAVQNFQVALSRNI